MESQGSKKPKQPTDRTSTVGVRTRATYDTLIRQSRKLGQAATQTLSGAGQSARQLLEQRGRQVPAGIPNIEELKKVVAHSHEVIARADTALPILFPHEIILDRTKITIVKRNFFWSTDVISIRIEDVLNVSGSVGPLFGSVTIASRVMSTVDHFEVANFWRRDAAMLTRIIEGYLIARQNGVETDHLSCEELAKTLYDLGPGR